MERTVILSRKVSFSAGHRYWKESLSEAENRALFGEWASPFNHGHNYVLWVSASGKVDESNGMVVNIKWIDDFLQDHVVARYDQKSINDEVDEMRSVVPNVENLLRNFAYTLQNLPGGVELTGLRLEETPLFYGEWTAEHNMVSITRIYEFAASHRLHVPELSHEENLRLFGKCNNPAGHGHNYVLEVTVTGEPEPDTGFVCSLTELDRVVEREVLSRYDHHNLDTDVEEIHGRYSTSEVVATAIYDRLKGAVPAQLLRIRLFETARNMFEVSA